MACDGTFNQAPHSSAGNVCIILCNCVSSVSNCSSCDYLSLSLWTQLQYAFSCKQIFAFVGSSQGKAEMSSDVYDMYAAAQPNNQPREGPTDCSRRGIMSKILRHQIQGLAHLMYMICYRTTRLTILHALNRYFPESDRPWIFSCVAVWDQSTIRCDCIVVLHRCLRTDMNDDSLKGWNCLIKLSVRFHVFWCRMSEILKASC